MSEVSFKEKPKLKYDHQTGDTGICEVQPNSSLTVFICWTMPNILYMYPGRAAKLWHHTFYIPITRIRIVYSDLIVDILCAIYRNCFQWCNECVLDVWRLRVSLSFISCRWETVAQTGKVMSDGMMECCPAMFCAMLVQTHLSHTTPGSLTRTKHDMHCVTSLPIR